MQTWISVGSHLGGVPAPGSSPSPVHPIGACIGFLRQTAAKGSFLINDQGGGFLTTAIELSVAPGAAARAAAGSVPTFDPYTACDLRALTRDQCNHLLAVVTTTLGSRQSQVQWLFARGEPVECATSASPCPIPAGFVGSVLAGTSGKTDFAFDVADIGGQLVVTEVPNKP